MKKLLLLSFILFSFLSSGQTTIKRPLVDTLGTTIQLFDDVQYLALFRNNKYSRLVDIDSYRFSNKNELNKFIDTLSKYTLIENYSDNFKDATIQTIIDGKTFSFVVHKKQDNIKNPNWDTYYALPYKERKNIEPPKSTIASSISYVELSLFTEQGWTYITKEEVDFIKSKIN
jgi:hypothetical protein